MMTTEEHAREMARVYIPHEGGFTMGGLLQTIIEYFEAEVATLTMDNGTLRHARNEAQQRAEQAARERAEAIAKLRQIAHISTSGVAAEATIKPAEVFQVGRPETPNKWTPPVILAGSLNNLKWSHTPIEHQIQRSRLAWSRIEDTEILARTQHELMIEAIGNLFDLVERLAKEG